MLISCEITLRVRFGLAWGVSTRFNLPPKPSSRSLWSAWVTALFDRFLVVKKFGRFGAVTTIVCHPNEIVKVLDSTKLAKSISYVWIVVVVVASDQSCSWEGPIKQSSRLRTIFSALAPVFSNLPAVWKSFQAPLRKSERRRSSVSVKAICDEQIFRVWKGESEKGVFTYANLTGWDWDSPPQWSDVILVVRVLCHGKKCGLCRKQPLNYVIFEYMKWRFIGRCYETHKISLFRCLW